jgi:hypothetical protein
MEDKPKILDTVKILHDFNQWRKGNVVELHHSTATIGVAIDAAIKMLEKSPHWPDPGRDIKDLECSDPFSRPGCQDSLYTWPDGKPIKHLISSTTLVDYLYFTVRTQNCLAAEEIATVGQLTDKTEDYLKSVPRLGRKSLNEIKDALAEFGLRLKPPAIS